MRLPQNLAPIFLPRIVPVIYWKLVSEHPINGQRLCGRREPARATRPEGQGWNGRGVSKRTPNHSTLHMRFEGVEHKGAGRDYEEFPMSEAPSCL